MVRLFRIVFTFFFFFLIAVIVRMPRTPQQIINNATSDAAKFFPCWKIPSLYSLTRWESSKLMSSNGMTNKTNITRLMSQLTQTQTKAFFLVFHIKYLRSNEMARYTFTTIARTEVRFKVMKARLIKVVINAKVFPLNQLTSKIDMIWNGKFITALSRSTTAKLPTRMFGTVRNDLNRARTPRTKPLPSTEHAVRTQVNKLMITLVKRAFAGYILRLYHESQMKSFGIWISIYQSAMAPPAGVHYWKWKLSS